MLCATRYNSGTAAFVPDDEDEEVEGNQGCHDNGAVADTNDPCEIHALSKAD